jgi:hypothetical protein
MDFNLLILLIFWELVVAIYIMNAQSSRPLAPLSFNSDTLEVAVSDDGAIGQLSFRADRAIFISLKSCITSQSDIRSPPKVLEKRQFGPL